MEVTPMPQKKSSRRDLWDKADVIIKGLGVILVSGAITFYGFYSENKRENTQFRIAEDSKRTDVFMRTMASRETAEANMKANMFATLMNAYFKKENPQSQVLFLKLIAHNFQEHLNIKPLFENLDSDLPESSPEKKELYKTARAIAMNEINSLVSNGGCSTELELVLNQELPAACNGPLPLKLRLVEVQKTRIRVSSRPEDKEGFEVTYFDMPFTDNSTLGELQYSVVLREAKKEHNQARVVVVVFPKYYYSSRDRLRIDRKIGDFLEESFTKE